MLLQSLAKLIVTPGTNSTNIIPLSKIKISPAMLSHPPKPYKIAQRYTYYLHNQQFQSPIILDQNYNLLDGYITYLIAKMMGHKTVTVKFAK
ncbi:hypothetical protein [Clostridium sp. HBUAS56010]|uniref:hypothetical protein n=1 Tax=Clostridium sp. HBUAS56010 TaxID=2571127 RepID=UPI0011775A4F|nr:hypothetical protein [Clostridium sp. HBUAS56010]